ncbi:MAG: GNAT family N-acetyltransferase [Cyanobacteria bacterium]|nr:GNAT family N-acetyltransferase [Cyanobacteria bacterium CG_2015-16_32_12]NCO79013.1 GNAT family N-acetyltransferase [Cyanobacteria bacterium CG_2015-22_32_23]NCQ41754.1 GNAT family N-acetyltransferase [Cyanobacteria bacterium CG_2015-04_32_10]NCS83860.1 GNAT family N-acetyltransferase [Cyanobacteria bacterium CG_2015-02_32_10]
MNFSHIQFCSDKTKIDLVQLLELYKNTAFWAQNRTLEDVKIAIINSNPVVSIWDNQRLIGSARATSDGIYRATIWDVVIHPDYQGYGLGSKLVETLITHPHLNRVERIYLTTTHQQKFYQKIGFTENPTTTMVLYNRYPTTNDFLKESQQLIIDN